MHGLIQGSVMRITSSLIKIIMVFPFFAVGSGYAYGTNSISWIPNLTGVVHLKLDKGKILDLPLSPEVEGTYYDTAIHQLKGEKFFMIFSVSPSNPEKPTGYCGAGHEIWLYVYRVYGRTLAERAKILAISCQHSFSLASQNSGGADVDYDFSSVQWNEQGFTVYWFNKVNESGQAIKSTSYTLHENAFVACNSLLEQDK